jgi:hypothetical protein
MIHGRGAADGAHPVLHPAATTREGASTMLHAFAEAGGA